MNGEGGAGKRHLTVDDRFRRSAPYKSPKSPRKLPVPVRANPAAHGRSLIRQVTQLQQDYAALAQSWESREEIRARGLIIELESAPGVGIEIERFQDQGLELLNQRDLRDAQGRMITQQTWFVPDGNTNSQEYVRGSTEGWIIGQQAHRGSLHSDIWHGSAADLLSMQHVAVYPMTGWWRTRPSQGRANARIKYALIVSIEAQNPSLDIYTDIANQISVPITVPAS